MKGITARGDGAELRHAVPPRRGEVLPRSGVAQEVEDARGAKARRLRRPGRRRGGGRDVRLPRLRPADHLRAGPAGAAVHHARLQPRPLVPAVAAPRRCDARSRTVVGPRPGRAVARVRGLHVRELRLRREPVSHRASAEPDGHGGGRDGHRAGAGGDAAHDRRRAADRGDRLHRLRARRTLAVRAGSTTGASASRSPSTRPTSPPRASSGCR